MLIFGAKNSNILDFFMVFNTVFRVFVLKVRKQEKLLFLF